MSDPKMLTPLASDRVDVESARASFEELSKSGPMRGLLRAGLSLSELADPKVQRALVDATMLDSMLNAERVTVTKSGEEIRSVDYKERRTAAGQFSKMKGFDAGESKRKRILEQVEDVKRFLAAEIVVPAAEKEEDAV